MIQLSAVVKEKREKIQKMQEFEEKNEVQALLINELKSEIVKFNKKNSFFTD